MTRRIAIATALCLASTFALGDDPKALPADKARDHLDKPGTYEMTVRSAKDVEPSKVHYINSEADYREEKNLALIIPYEALPAFKKAGIGDPASFYLMKRIRVTGTPKRDRDQTRMRIEDPKSITVLEDRKP